MSVEKKTVERLSQKYGGRYGYHGCSTIGTIFLENPPEEGEWDRVKRMRKERSRLARGGRNNGWRRPPVTTLEEALKGNKKLSQKQFHL